MTVQGCINMIIYFQPQTKNSDILQNLFLINIYFKFMMYFFIQMLLLI